MKKNASEERFFWNVLRTLVALNGERSIEEILVKYSQLYPPNFIVRKIGLSVSLQKIQRVITQMEALKYVYKNVTRYIHSPTKRDILVYSITPLGMQALPGKEKK